MKHTVQALAQACRRNPLKTAACVSCLALAALAVIWMTYNISHQPVYGDSVEYWALSQTLDIDSWRTIAYPLLLRVAGGLAAEPAQMLVYIIQLALTFYAALYFFKTVALFTPRTKLHKNELLLLAGALAAMPLLVHFSFSILTDSFASSLFIIGILAVARILFLHKADVLTLAVASASIFASGVIRSERVLFFGTILLGCIVWLLIRRRWRRAAITGILLVPLMLGFITNVITQHPNPERPPLTTTSSIFARTNRTLLADHMQEMPPLIQQRISPDLAAKWQQDEIYTLPVLAQLNDEAGQLAMRSAIKRAVLCCSMHIAMESGGDLIEYILSPFTYMKETVFESVDPTRWTNTRMSMFHPRITKLYIYSSFLLLLAACAASVWGVARRRMKIHTGFLLYIVLIILLISSAIATRSSLDFHIRYGLPIYMIETGLLIWVGWVGLFKNRR